MLLHCCSLSRVTYRFALCKTGCCFAHQAQMSSYPEVSLQSVEQDVAANEAREQSNAFRFLISQISPKCDGKNDVASLLLRAVLSCNTCRRLLFVCGPLFVVRYELPLWSVRSAIDSRFGDLRVRNRRFCFERSVFGQLRNNSQRARNRAPSSKASADRQTDRGICCRGSRWKGRRGGRGRFGDRTSAIARVIHCFDGFGGSTRRFE